MSQPYITFAVHIEESGREKVVRYPVLEELETNLNGIICELGYRFRDYGKLSFALVKRLEESDTLSQAPKALRGILDSYKLEELVGSAVRAVSKYTKWMINAECPKIRVLTIVKRKKKIAYWGAKYGDFFLRAALRSPNLAQSLENLILFRVLARKLENLGKTFGIVRQYGAITCICERIRGKNIKIPSLQGAKTEIRWKELFANLWNAYLIHVEAPVSIPFYESPNIPGVLSGIIYNEIYRLHHNLRSLLQEWINNAAQGASNLVTMDPFKVSDRMPQEITRALEKLGLLQVVYGVRYTCIPDQLLSDLVGYFGEYLSEEIQLRHKEPPNEAPLNKFVDTLREQFRILVNPNDVIDFLKSSVNYASLGMDLGKAHSYLISNYDALIERLESLGLATIRPDGDVMIRIAY